MPAPYTGSCLCGAVRLAISGEPAAVLSCFCQHCTKGAGGSHQLIAKFAEPDVQLTVADDAISEYTFTDTSSGSPKLKAFCRTCGCPLWTVPNAAKGKFLLIRTTLLEDGLSIKPQNEIFVKNRPQWMAASEGVSQWEEMRK
ncbi:Mss4-like protein [Plectosphaerella cucumerina]|uniref:Mss4-like protein n=1 Tax=Plectosphaerella cucumerina TaxID=40658 RepID=A0A8K0T775_9PEZI|nr:Mss4-like protein [Plectosphaerella cucumerina]